MATAARKAAGGRQVDHAFCPWLGESPPSWDLIWAVRGDLIRIVTTKIVVITTIIITIKTITITSPASAFQHQPSPTRLGRNMIPERERERHLNETRYSSRRGNSVNGMLRCIYIYMYTYAYIYILKYTNMCIYIYIDKAI